ncbi:MAG: SRPBCC family protein [Chloroflexi bacterium]|nr:SRPBCC family protein [Chloroflexota bacterium]
MQTTTSLFMYAEPARIYALACDTPRWPELLPHYRWVRTLEQSADARRRVLHMAATRDGIPVEWLAEQLCIPCHYRIEFHHIGGVTRGMHVAWTLEGRTRGTHVSIWHSFQPNWPCVPDVLVQLIIGDFFIDNIARKTLGRFRALAETSPNLHDMGEPR